MDSKGAIANHMGWDMSFFESGLALDVMSMEANTGQTEPISLRPELYDDPFGAAVQWYNSRNENQSLSFVYLLKPLETPDEESRIKKCKIGTITEPFGTDSGHNHCHDSPTVQFGQFGRFEGFPTEFDMRFFQHTKIIMQIEILMVINKIMHSVHEIHR